jgi:hypothetical protein
MTDTLTRPWLTLSELAEASGRHRRTIRRMLDAGAFGDGARQDEEGRWVVAVDAALAAGLALHRSRPEEQPEGRNTSIEDSAQGHELAALRAQLADAERRALIAEAEARGMRDALAALQEAVGAMARALPAGDTPQGRRDDATMVATMAEEHHRRSRWWRRHRTTATAT